MTHQEILTKAIEKASAGDYDELHDCKLVSLDEDIAYGYIQLTNVHQGIFDMPLYNLIFNHDFAKALWGEEPVDYWVEDGSDNLPEGYQDGARFKYPIWKYQLEMMVIADDPIKYLGDNI